MSILSATQSAKRKKRAHWSKQHRIIYGRASSSLGIRVNSYKHERRLRAILDEFDKLVDEIEAEEAKR